MKEPYTNNLVVEEVEEKRKLNSYAVLGGFLLCLFLGTYFIVNFVIEHKNTECIQNPFGYGSQQMEKKWGYDFNGVANFRVINSPFFVINRTGLFQTENPGK